LQLHQNKSLNGVEAQETVSRHIANIPPHDTMPKQNNVDEYSRPIGYRPEKFSRPLYFRCKCSKPCMHKYVLLSTIFMIQDKVAQSSTVFVFSVGYS
jgi:hypothetical protein